MNNEDMSDIIQKLSSMINNSNLNSDNQNENTNSNDISSDSNNFNEDTLKNIFNNLNNQNFSNSSNNTENNFNFDINTMLKMKNIMDKVNSSKNDPRSNLLVSLKPYLNNNRKEKLDQYMQFLNISKIIEAFQADGGVNNK